MGFVPQSEIQIFRKAIGLEIALLEAGPAFEDPARPQDFIGIDSGQEPPQHIVLFDDVRRQSSLVCKGDDFVPVDHSSWPLGTHSRHFVTSFFSCALLSRNA